MSIDTVRTGRPTAPSVRLLMDQYAGAVRGTKITYTELEGAIGEKRNSNRFRAVVGVWRKAMLRERGVLLAARMNEGYELLFANEQMRAAVGRVRAASRRVAEGVVVAERTPEGDLDDAMKRSRMHMLTRGTMLLATVRAEARALEMRPPAATRTVPKMSGSD